jgi:hypothetical protein
MVQQRSTHCLFFAPFFIFRNPRCFHGRPFTATLGDFENIRVLTFSLTPPQFCIGGNNHGSITRLDQHMNVITKEFSHRGHVVASQLDPNNPLNCRIVWNNGAWALFDPTTLTALHKVLNSIVQFGVQ